MDMQRITDASLKQFNSFGLNVKTRELVIFENEEEIIPFLDEKDLDKYLILGGGSNLLFLNDFDGIVVKNNCSGISVYDQDSNYVIVEANAGEEWDNLVRHCVENEFYGIENLGLIPGTVGAAPVQNIGAYGVELKDVFHSLSGFDLIKKEKREFILEDCNFGYRESIFKNELKQKFLITSVRLKLRKEKSFKLNYRAIRDAIDLQNQDELTIQNIYQAIKKIRESKLPEVSRLGNAGSFFKNPEIDPESFSLIKSKFHGLVAFQVEGGNYKIPAGWLIEQCGFKGKRIGNVGCYEKQSLVIVNFGDATGQEIFDFSKTIQNSVLEKFNVMLTPEVNIIQ